MSGEQDDPVEILSDDGSDGTQTETNITTKKESTKGTSLAGSATTVSSKSGTSSKYNNMVNEPDPQPSTSKDKNDETEEMNGNDHDDDPEEDNPSEYNVEAIRAKRKNKHGVDEYYIKWEGYPEDENTWEPLENLKCPELISRFNEQEANKRRKKKAERLGASQASATKRPRREAAASTGGTSSQTNDNCDDTESLFVEGDDEENDSHAEQTRKKSKGHQNKDSHQTSAPPAPRGFDRNLPIEKIITASVGDDDRLYFFLKWQGRNEIEMVDADELEKKCPYTLCRWYRDRLYWDSGDREQQLKTTKAQ